MLELALLLFGISAWAPTLFPQSSDFSAGALALGEVLFIATVIAGLVALAFHEPIERRVFHHA
jgi:hypothetical protein